MNKGSCRPSAKKTENLVECMLYAAKMNDDIRTCDE